MSLHDMIKHDNDELERARRREQLCAVAGRTEQLGMDRYGRRYWAFDAGGGVEAALYVQPRTADVRRVLTAPPPDAPAAADAWQHFTGDEACLAIAASLDSRGVRERALQSALRAHVQLSALRRRVAEAEAAEEAAAARAAGEDEGEDDDGPAGDADFMGD